MEEKTLLSVCDTSGTFSTEGLSKSAAIYCSFKTLGTAHSAIEKKCVENAPIGVFDLYQYVR
jgi:hypothetical protein